MVITPNSLTNCWRDEARAGSLDRIGRRPPKPVVVGSNPTPPATTNPKYARVGDGGYALDFSSMNTAFRCQ